MMKFSFPKLFKLYLDEPPRKLITDIPKAPYHEDKAPFDYDQYQMNKVSDLIKQSLGDNLKEVFLNEETLRCKVKSELNLLGYKVEWIAYSDEAATRISW